MCLTPLSMRIKARLKNGKLRKVNDDAPADVHRMGRAEII